MRTPMRHFLLIIVFILSYSLCDAAPKFYPDDPLALQADTQDASRVAEWEIDLIYDLAENVFYRPGDKAPDVRAQNVNTIDEVPDSSWYTNRKNLTLADVARGPNTTEGPAAGKWTVISAKNDGVSPGFTVKDSTDRTWFIKPDPPGYPGMATGSEVAATKLFWALGFYVPEDHIATMKLDDLVIAPGTKIKVPSGKKRDMRVSDIHIMMRRGEKSPDGSYRVHASLELPGKTLGGFRLYGTRPDDPNDVIPHEHRRELRGYSVFAAWLNHVDIKALQSMDVLETANGKSFVRHYLLDFSSALGSGSIYPHDYWEGFENLLERGNDIAKDSATFGLRVEPWRTAKFYESKAIGRFPEDNSNWNPDEWKPRVPNAALLRATAEDKFWAARKLMAISDDMIRAAIAAGKFNDPDGEAFLVKALIQRRDAILRQYLPAVNPIVDPALDDSGVLTFANAAVKAGVASPATEYQATWYRFDNASSSTQAIGKSAGNSERVNAPAGLPNENGAYVMIEISATSSEHSQWQTPVRSYFLRSEQGWKLVGLER